MGISTVLRRDVLSLFKRKEKRIISEVATEKILIVLLLLCASMLSLGSLGDTILKFAFMSMGLRGATIFMPLCFSLWGRECVGKQYAGVAIVLGPVTVLIFELLGVLPFDPLFAGVAASAVVMLAGFLAKKRKTRRFNK